MRRTGGIRRSRICLFVKLFSNFALLGLGDVARTRPDLYDLQYHLRYGRGKKQTCIRWRSLMFWKGAFRPFIGMALE